MRNPPLLPVCLHSISHFHIVHLTVCFFIFTRWLFWAFFSHLRRRGPSAFVCATTTEQSRLKSTHGGKGPKASEVVAGSFHHVSASNYGVQLVKRHRQKSRVKPRSLFSKLTIGRQRKEEVLPQRAAQEKTTELGTFMQTIDFFSLKTNQIGFLSFTWRSLQIPL